MTTQELLKELAFSVSLIIGYSFIGAFVLSFFANSKEDTPEVFAIAVIFWPFVFLLLMCDVAIKGGIDLSRRVNKIFTKED